MNTLLLRCPCCNEELDEYELDMFELLEGMKEECYNKVMEAAYEGIDNTYVKSLDLDWEE